MELCLALAILALVAGLAAPGFQASLRAAAVRAATFEVLAGLQRVRASAIVESRPGSFCPADARGDCLPVRAPGNAWRITLDEAAAGADGGVDLSLRQPLPRGVQLRATRSPLRFWPTSHAASTGTLTICDVRGIAAPRAIVISQTGRARLTGAAAGACDP